jgi:iron complex outermembrane receptor protein
MLVTYLNRYAAACWLVILLLGTSSTTAATEAPNPSDSELDIPPVIVRGEMPAPAPAASTQSLTRQPSSAVRISSDDIQQSRGYNLEDVLRLAPGVVFQSRGGATDGKLNLRGTNLSSNINTWGITLLVNGLPFNAADGFAQLNTIDLQTVDHIEVYKGAQAIKFGANSLGGAVNFILKTGVNQARIQVRGEGGSFGFYQALLTVR